MVLDTTIRILYCTNYQSIIVVFLCSSNIDTDNLAIQPLLDLSVRLLNAVKFPMESLIPIS